MSLKTSIQLPSTSESEETKDKVICRLCASCRRQFAKYTCPTCNVPYCSLTCFRSPAHNQCSESFYKKEIEADIHGQPSKTAQERKKMMELLQRFEEGSMESSNADEEEEDEDSLDLSRRFEHVDLDTLPPDQLWSMLKPEERSKFMKAFRDPTGEIAQQLLASEELEKEIQDPWWESTESSDEESVPGGHDKPQYIRRRGKRPNLMSIPTTMVKPIPIGHPLVYNVSAICIAYAYITRRLGVSSLSGLKDINDSSMVEARRLISHFVPFISDRKSTKIYLNLSAVITEIWSLFDLGEVSSDLFVLLLWDATQLMKPLRVVSSLPNVSDGDVNSHPHIMSVLVLSDLYDLFSVPPQSPTSHSKEEYSKGKYKYITQKLLFYAAHILSTPSVILHGLVVEMKARSEGYRAEADNKWTKVGSQ